MKARSKVDQRATGGLDSGAARSRRLKTRLMAVIASAVAASALSAGTAQAATVTVFPNNPVVENCYPFGAGNPAGDPWTPFAAFIYQNVPSFELTTGDTLAFDLGAVNDADIELEIALARTVSNGTIVEGEPFKQVVSNDQTPANPRGDTTVGNFELQFTAEAPFSFPGGGLIIRFSDPSTSYEADTSCDQVLVGASSTDTSGFFVRRAFKDADGVAPWSGGLFDTVSIGAFRVVTTDPTPPEPPPNPQPPPSPPPGTPPPEALTLDLGAKKQELRKKIKFSATASAASTLVATGKKIKETTKQLAANEKTKVKAKLKRKARNRLEEKLDKKGKAKVKVKGTATGQGGAEATDTVKVKLKD
jgi:hypothetical protein